MRQEEKVLVIDGDEESLLSLTGFLKTVGYHIDDIIQCSHVTQITNLDGGDVRIILIDLSFPGFSCSETFTRVRNKFPLVPIIVFSGSAEIEVAINAIRDGAQDYLIKGEFDKKILAKAIQYAIERKKKDADYRRLFEDSPVPLYIYDSSSFQLPRIL